MGMELVDSKITTLGISRSPLEAARSSRCHLDFQARPMLAAQPLEDSNPSAKHHAPKRVKPGNVSS